MKQIHGGNIIGDGSIIDFSVNLNPAGMPESVKKAVLSSAGEWERYPDHECAALIKKLSEREGFPAPNIVCGNGADDLIYRFAHAFKPKNALICAPTFGEYAKALAEVGCTVREHFLREENGFALTDGILDELTRDTDAVILCSPNNPTGQLIPRDILRGIAEKCAENGTLLLCDECFIGFVRDGEDYSLKRFMNESCIVLRAFTKLYSMAGLRLGHALCGSAENAERLRNSGQYWSVSAPAQAAGTAALGEEKYAAETAERTERERVFLSAALAGLGLKVYPSAANYILFKGTEGLDDRLPAEHILIRNCESYRGLGAGFYRAAVRCHEDNLRLIKAIERCENG